MKKLLYILLLLLISVSASAQETNSINVTVANVPRLDHGRILYNNNTCTGQGLAIGCTQAQACAASLARTGAPASGSSCTASEALANAARIYPNTQPGREQYHQDQIFKTALDRIDREWAKTGAFDFQAWCKTATTPQIDQICTDHGKSAGCGVCDSWR